MLHSMIEIPNWDQPLHTICLHLGLFARWRRTQLQTVTDYITQHIPGDAPLIIAGDFNDWSNALSDALRERLGVAEVFDERLPSSRFGTYLRRLAGRGPKQAPARTFPAAMPVLQLDRVYVRGFRVASARVLHGASWARLSDHAPIVAELELVPVAAAAEREAEHAHG